MAVNPPPMTTTGKRSCIFAMDSFFAAPVSCKAIRKSEAVRTPRANPFGISRTVGLPAPIARATWSKPMANASSSVMVPPKRTPPNNANCRRRSSNKRINFRKFLSHRTVMPYSATPPKPAMVRASSDSCSEPISCIGSKLARPPCASTPDNSACSGSIFRPSIPTTVWPSFIRKCASVKPAGPMPITSTRFPLGALG